MNLYSFGDSWSYGCGLDSPKFAFGKIIANKINCSEFYNRSVPSSSITHLLIQLEETLNDPLVRPCYGDIALFFLTDPSRDMIWKTGNIEFMSAHNNSKLSTNWYENFYSTELETYKVNSTILSLQKTCEHYGLRDYYVWGWQKSDLWETVDKRRFWKKGEYTLVEQLTKDAGLSQNTIYEFKNTHNIYSIPNDGHPSQQGHTRIAEVLGDWISNQDREYLRQLTK